MNRTTFRVIIGGNSLRRDITEDQFMVVDAGAAVAVKVGKGFRPLDVRMFAPGRPGAPVPVEQGGTFQANGVWLPEYFFPDQVNAPEFTA